MTAILLAFAALSGPAAHQDCCLLTLDTVAVIENQDPRVTVTGGAYIAAVDGKYVVAPVYTYPHLALFDSSGGLEAYYDREGEGPGEFSGGVIRLATPGEHELLAIQGARVFRFSAGLAFQEERRLPYRTYDVVSYSGDRLAVNFPVEVNGDRKLVHVFQEDGRSWEPVGSALAPLDGLNAFSWGSLRLLAPDPRGGFVSGHPGRSDFTFHDPDGQVSGSLAVEREWFDPWTRDPESSSPPRQQVLGIKVIAPHHLLILTRVVEEGAEPTQSADPSADQGIGFDTVLEAADLSTGRVVSRFRLPELWNSVGGATPEIFTLSPMADGQFRITIVSVSLILQDEGDLPRLGDER